MCVCVCVSVPVLYELSHSRPEMCHSQLLVTAYVCMPRDKTETNNTLSSV